MARIRGRALGEGAFGSVFEVDHPTFGAVAAKVLGPGVAIDRDAFEAMAGVRHPNLLRLLAIEEDDGRPCVIMERVRGVDLLRWVRPKTTERRAVRATLPLAFGQPLQEGGLSAFTPIDRAGLVRLRSSIVQLARALGALHAIGRVHRDVRPENVLVEEDGRLVLVDFGLLSREGARDVEIAGSPAYMAPDEVPTAASDLYAMGILLFEALTGALPFAGSAEEVVVRKRTVTAPSASFVVELPDCDDARVLDTLCTQLVRRAPSMRPTCEEVLATLDQKPAPHTS